MNDVPPQSIDAATEAAVAQSLALADLGQQADEGERTRFLELAWPHFDSLQQTALYLTGESDAAQRSVQETYHRAWQHFLHEGNAQTPEDTRRWLLAVLTDVTATRVLQDTAADALDSVNGQVVAPTDTQETTPAASPRKRTASGPPVAPCCRLGG